MGGREAAALRGEYAGPLGEEVMARRRIRQIRRYLIILADQPYIRGPYKTDAARRKVADANYVGRCLILDVSFHKRIHPEDRRPLVDIVWQTGTVYKDA